MTDQAPAVTGKPLRWLQLDGLVLLAAALILFASTHQPWWLVPAVILLPDLFMLGYLRDTRVGAAVYNSGTRTCCRRPCRWSAPSATTR